MAVVTTSKAPDPNPFSWVDLPLYKSNRSAVPKAEIRFNITDNAIAATGVGDNQFLQVDCLLPKNNAYALVDFTLSVRQTTDGATNNFSDIGAANVYSSSILSSAHLHPNYEILSSGAGAWNNGPDNIKCYSINNKPKMIIMASAPADQPGMRLSLFNGSTNDSLYVYSMLARFLQYDIEQAYNWGVNAPMLTR